MAHTYDDSTVAAQPGHLKISPRKYLDYTGLTGPIRLKYRMLLHLPRRILFGLFKSDQIVHDYVGYAEQFRFGCINPSVIVDAENGLIATFTSLTGSGDQPTPVIRISEEPLHLIKNTLIENGQRIATVAFYIRNMADPTATVWADFDPKIPQCFTDDTSACNDLMSKISGNAWTCLNLGLEQVPYPYQTGLYHIQLDPTLVWSAY